jgi:hypothetical protein
MPSFCQDRLGTNIGKAEKQGGVFLQGRHFGAGLATVPSLFRRRRPSGAAEERKKERKKEKNPASFCTVFRTVAPVLANGHFSEQKAPQTKQ